jgi:hypothetical protein
MTTLSRATAFIDPSMIVLLLAEAHRSLTVAALNWSREASERLRPGSRLDAVHSENSFSVRLGLDRRMLLPGGSA